MKVTGIVDQMIETRLARPELVPFASGVAPGTARERLRTLNASEMGRCSRQLWYERHGGVKVEGDMARPGIFDRGHAAEAWAVAMLSATLEAKGSRLRYAGNDQTRLIEKKVRVAGTPDGLIMEAAELVLEVKSYGSTVDRSTSPSPANVKQAELNIELFHRRTRHRPIGALILYVSAEDYTQMHAYRIDRREAVWIEAIGKAREILDAKAAIDVMPMPGPLCQLCPFRGQCAAAELRNMPLGERVTPGDLGNLNALVVALLSVRADQARLAELEVEHLEGIKQALRELGLRRARQPAWDVSWTARPEAPALDETALAKVLGDLRPYLKDAEMIEELVVRGR